MFNPSEEPTWLVLAGSLVCTLLDLLFAKSSDFGHKTSRSTNIRNVAFLSSVTDGRNHIVRIN